ncbi:MAG: hypothetical protein IT305_06820 [Chloroflexi bacterium]|nr:hypothetical protein [Chloroflexota bacterium]
MDERLFYLDYTLQLPESSRDDLPGFWDWYRADNRLMTSLIGDPDAQRVFVSRVGPDVIIERIEVKGFQGISQYFIDLNAAKERVPNPAARLDEFYRRVEISDFRVRGTGPVFERVEAGNHKVYVVDNYRYRHAARARAGEMWDGVRAVDDALRSSVSTIRAIQTYTEVIGSHWQFSRWIAFDTLGEAVGYLDIRRSEAIGDEPGVGGLKQLNVWGELLASSVIEEVPAT